MEGNEGKEGGPDLPFKLRLLHKALILLSWYSFNKYGGKEYAYDDEECQILLIPAIDHSGSLGNINEKALKKAIAAIGRNINTPSFSGSSAGSWA